MSGIGFWELILLFLIGLIVLGPERLPRVANQLGSWLGQARRMTRVMKRQLEEELNIENDLGAGKPRLSGPKEDHWARTPSAPPVPGPPASPPEELAGERASESDKPPAGTEPPGKDT